MVARLLLVVAAALVARAALAGDDARREIRGEVEFRRLVGGSDRVFLVEFYSGMCAYCQQFEPTWLALAARANRLEPARVNIDAEGGETLAAALGVLDEGIPCVAVFGDAAAATSHDTLMAGEILPLSRLVKRVHRATKGRGLATDAEGFFLRRPATGFKKAR